MRCRSRASSRRPLRRAPGAGYRAITHRNSVTRRFVSRATIRIRESLDVFQAREEVRAVAGGVGFDRVACEELAIVVTELCTNILKYAGEGELEVERVLHDGEAAGVAVEARDRGPPIEDFQLAVRDGYDAEGPVDPAQLLHRGGLGAGLGAVVRLSHQLVYSDRDGQKFVRATRYLRALSRS